MPRFGVDNLLTSEQINDAAEYTLSLSGKATDPTAATRGAVLFKEQCASCHGDDGKGKADQGSPNLTDGIWLYGGSKAAIVESIRTGRGGAMPAWAGTARSRDVEGVGGLRPHPRRRQVSTP